MRSSRMVTLVSALLACGGGGGAGGAASAGEVVLATGQAGDVAVELLAAGGLREGQNTARIRLLRAGTPVTGAALTVDARRAAAGAVPAVVVAAPAETAPGVYAADLVLPAPGEDWTVLVTVDLEGEARPRVELGMLRAAATGRAAWIGDVLVTLGFEAGPGVGENPVTVTVHRLAGGALAAVDDAAVHLDPEMPSMGHGAPAGTDPTRVSPGRYRGTVDFTMRGEWVVTAEVSEGGGPLGSAVFPVGL